MTIKAIETVYAGHRFRSRLEARWAVFFDTLGIEWRYEPEGFEIGTAPPGKQCDCTDWMCDCKPMLLTTRYLPDFYLPKEKLWVEVKGVIDSDALLTLAVHCIDPWSGPTLPGDDRLMIVGELPPPHPDNICMHEFYYWRKGTKRTLAYFDTRCLGPGWNKPLIREIENWGLDYCDYYDGTALAEKPSESSFLGDIRPHWVMADGLTMARRNFDYAVARSEKFRNWYFAHNIVGGHPFADPAVSAAYDAARKARFEFGDTPKPVAVKSATRRDPEAVALELLKQELGSRLI